MSDEPRKKWFRDPEWWKSNAASAILGAAVVAGIGALANSISDVMRMGADYPGPFGIVVLSFLGFGAALGYGESVLLGVRDARVRREEADRKESSDAADSERRERERLSSLRGSVMSMEFEDKEFLARLLFYGPVELPKELRESFRRKCRNIIDLLCFEPTSKETDRWDLTSSARDSLGGCKDLLEAARAKLEEDCDSDGSEGD